MNRLRGTPITGRAVVVWLAALVLTLSTASVARAQSPDAAAAWAAANDLYEEGSFAQAAQAYRQLASQGYRDAAIFYNLGNAYYKQGETGLAVLNYLRAQRLAPRDADVENNLRMARERTVDVTAEGDGSGPAGVLSAYWPTVDELSVGVLILWNLTALSLAAWLLIRARPGRRAALYAAAAAGVLLLLAAASLGGRLFLDDSADDAVVVADKVEVRSGPGDGYVTEFELHAGAEARLIEERGSWARVALPNGDLQGWAPAAAVERVSLPRLRD